MNSLKNYVTPLTRGLIWFPQDEDYKQDPFYAEIDYLLDGLLTLNFNGPQKVSSRVLISQNFHKVFHLMIIHEFQKNELESFLSLFKSNLLQEEDVLVIDQAEKFPEVKKHFQSISGQLRFIS